MKYITTEEAAKKLNISARTIRDYCVKGKITGAKQNGKTWLVPSDIEKPLRENAKGEVVDKESISLANKLVDFIDNSPVSFFAVNNVANSLLELGYKEVFENIPFTINKGDKFFLRRNDSTLLAFNIGNNINETSGFHIVASHADSPCFKVKPDSESKTDIYNKINLAPYGGLIASTWLDRPLSIAGRVIFNKDNEIISQLVNLEELTVMIPNLPIHFNRDVNRGYEYNMAVDMQAFISQDKEIGTLKNILAKKLGVNNDSIINYDLFVYNKQGGLIWGSQKEYISSPRLDDLECVFSSLEAFKNSGNDYDINVLYISDNEEVGCLSRQGADSDFLKNNINKIANALNMDVSVMIANSFLVSADNGHAVHPNKPGVTDADNKIYMNKGIAIKFNAAQLYTSDALSSSIFQKLCDNADTPYQFFTNRSDLRGGSTLGSILLSQVSMMSIDVGLPQLAMHSSYETAGCKDIKYAVKVFENFYESSLAIKENKISIISHK